MVNVICPYCGKDHVFDGSESVDVFDEGTQYFTCELCDHEFTYHFSVTIETDAEKADCLNGLAEHEWKPTVTIPTCMTRMRCQVCSTEREPTKTEWMKILDEEEKKQ